MDTTLSTDRAYFNADGRLIFNFSSYPGSTSSAARVIDSTESLLVGRQSPVAAVLASMAVLTFAFVSIQAPLSSTVERSLANTIQASSDGFRVIAAASFERGAQNVSVAYGRMWGGSSAPALLPFASLAVRVAGSSGSSAQTVPVPDTLLRDVAVLENTRGTTLAAVASAALVSMQPASVFESVQGAYGKLGMTLYGGILSIMQTYVRGVGEAGTRAYAVGGSLRDVIIAAPVGVAQVLQSMGEVIIATTHLAIGTEVAFVYGFVDASPRVARTLTLAVGDTGALLGQGAEVASPLALRAFVWTLREPSSAAPELSRAVIAGTYAGAQQFIAVTQSLQTRYSQSVRRAGTSLYASVAYADMAERAVRNESVPHLLQQVYRVTLSHGTELLSAVFIGNSRLATPAQ